MLLRSNSRHRRFRETVVDRLEKMGYRRVAHMTKNMKRRGIAIRTHARSARSIEDTATAALPSLCSTFEELGIRDFVLENGVECIGNREALLFSMYA